MRRYIALIVLFFLLGFYGSVAAESLKLPDQYVGYWMTSSPQRGGDFAYDIKADGTMDFVQNFGKRIKYEDIHYRILRIEANRIILLTKHQDTPYAMKKYSDSRHTYYKFRILEPFKYVTNYPKLWIYTLRGNERISKAIWLLPQDKLLQYFDDKGFINHISITEAFYHLNDATTAPPR